MIQDKNDTDDANDSFFIEHLQKQLDDLEYLEILKSLTTEDLEEKGLLNTSETVADHAGKNYKTDKEELAFSPTVDFYRINDDIVFDNLNPEDYQFIKNTESKTLIATQKENHLYPVKNGDNVIQDISEGLVKFYSKVTGKVILLNDSLCIIPSDIDCKVQITVSPDNLDAFAVFKPGFGNGKVLSVDFVKIALAKMNINVGVNDNIISEMVDKTNSTGKTQSDIHLAHGQPPIPGKDGFIQYNFDYRTEEYGFTILPDGRIDYHNVKNIPMIKAKEKIAEIIPPADGTHGIDIYGIWIGATRGKNAILIPGSGVDFDKDTNEFFASIDGIVTVNGSLIEVMESYVVNGDVDFSTGNISFTGNVFINGTIIEGFSVKAGGDIVVSKNIESAHVEAGRNITVFGGILGKGKGLVSAGKNVKAAYIQNAIIEAQGDIVIKNFAVNSMLYTSGNLYIKDLKGSLLGGEAYVQRSVEVKNLGSPAGTKTHIEAGTDYLLKRKITELNNIISFYKQNITKLDSSLKIVVLDIQKNNSLLASKKVLIKKALDKKKDLETKLKVISVKKYDLEKIQYNSDECRIRVKNNLYPDVIIKMRERRLQNDIKRFNVDIYYDRNAENVVIAPA